jgi:clan AA aspartic protease (TIGR02281 family)
MSPAIEHRRRGVSRRVRQGLIAACIAILAAGPARGQRASRGENEARLFTDGTNWAVHATLNGRVRGLFLLDAGARLCAVSPEMARRLGVGNHDLLDLHTTKGVVRVPLVELGSVDIGRRRARGVEAVVYSVVPPPLDGVIGLSFLDRFDYEIDPDRHVLRLR